MDNEIQEFLITWHHYLLPIIYLLKKTLNIYEFRLLSIYYTEEHSAQYFKCQPGTSIIIKLYNLI